MYPACIDTMVDIWCSDNGNRSCAGALLLRLSPFSYPIPNFYACLLRLYAPCNRHSDPSFACSQYKWSLSLTEATLLALCWHFTGNPQSAGTGFDPARPSSICTHFCQGLRCGGLWHFSLPHMQMKCNNMIFQAARTASYIWQLVIV